MLSRTDYHKTKSVPLIVDNSPTATNLGAALFDNTNDAAFDKYPAPSDKNRATSDDNSNLNIPVSLSDSSDLVIQRLHGTDYIDRSKLPQELMPD